MVKTKIQGILQFLILDTDKYQPMDKKHFFLKLNPPRASFMMDMTTHEKEIMMQHVAYWAPFVKDGTVIVLGPVFDPKGGYGIAVVAVDNETQLNAMVAADPAIAINTYEIYPMKAVTPS